MLGGQTRFEIRDPILSLDVMNSKYHHPDLCVSWPKTSSFKSYSWAQSDLQMDQELPSFLPPVSLVLVPWGSISCFSMSWILYGCVRLFLRLLNSKCVCMCVCAVSGWIVDDCAREGEECFSLWADDWISGCWMLFGFFGRVLMVCWFYLNKDEDGWLCNEGGALL